MEILWSHLSSKGSPPRHIHFKLDRVAIHHGRKISGRRGELCSQVDGPALPRPRLHRADQFDLLLNHHQASIQLSIPTAHFSRTQCSPLRECLRLVASDIQRRPEHFRKSKASYIPKEVVFSRA